MTPPVITAIGGLCLICSLIVALLQHSWISKASMSRGKVVEMVRGWGGKVAPRVEFQTADGVRHVFTGNVFVRKSEFKEGNSVLVAYDAQRIQGRILTFEERYTGFVLLSALGLAMLWMGGWYLIGPRFVPRNYVETTHAAIDPNYFRGLRPHQETPIRNRKKHDEPNQS